jgi:IS30 family transposase
MARKYKRLSFEDRKRIQSMGRSGSRVLDISQALGIHRDTIYKELKRCHMDLESYDAEEAQKLL